MSTGDKYLEQLHRKAEEARERLNKARALYQSPATEFDSPLLGQMLWNDYEEALKASQWIDQLIRDYCGSAKKETRSTE